LHTAAARIAERLAAAAKGQTAAAKLLNEVGGRLVQLHTVGRARGRAHCHRHRVPYCQPKRKWKGCRENGKAEERMERLKRMESLCLKKMERLKREWKG
jgi:hypothetical protein